MIETLQKAVHQLERWDGWCGLKAEEIAFLWSGPRRKFASLTLIPALYALALCIQGVSIPLSALGMIVHCWRRG